MCLLCIEFQRNKMTKGEIRAALGELVTSTKTYEEVKHYLELEKAMAEDGLYEGSEDEKLNDELK